MTTHKVFVYGLLKRERSMNYILNSGPDAGRCLGNALTVKTYHMYQLYSYPGITPSNDQSARQISGEVWSVNDAMLKRLDLVEIGFERETIYVEPHGKVWSYIWKAAIPGFNLIQGKKDRALEW